jgi:hypothetical protein
MTDEERESNLRLALVGDKHLYAYRNNARFYHDINRMVQIIPFLVDIMAESAEENARAYAAALTVAMQLGGSNDPPSK